MRTILVCGSVSYFADDVHARCACGAPIVHRPHGPVEAVKLCVSCASKQFAIEPPTEIAVTEDTVREVALYQTRTKGVQ